MNFGRQNSNARSNSRQNFNQGQNINRSRSANRPGNFNARSGSRSLERPKENLYKDVEKIKKKSEKLEKGLNEVKEILKNKLISTQFVEEEIVIDVKYVNKGEERMMSIDNGAPKSIVSSR